MAKGLYVDQSYLSAAQTGTALSVCNMQDRFLQWVFRTLSLKNRSSRFPSQESVLDFQVLEKNLA